MIDALLDQDIESRVTLYHRDPPTILNDRTTTRGWLNPKVSDLFNNYATDCLNNFGGKVKRWLIVNKITVSDWIGKLEHGVIYWSSSCDPGTCKSYSKI